MVTQERRLRDLTTICEINLRISSEQALDNLLDLIAFYATVLLEAQRAMLMLIDRTTGKLVVRSCYGDLPDDVTRGAAFPGAVAAQLATDAQVRYLLVTPENRSALPFLRADAEDWGIIAAILGKGGTIGILAVESKVNKGPFEDYDGEVLQMLVAQAGIAIENAQIYESFNYLVDLRTKELEEERDRSESLLLNVLPRDVVEELHAHGVVKPRRFDNVSVLFTDFCSFTTIAERMNPEALLAQLEAFYAAFDEICTRHGLERLKTIGDAYMCVAGVPTPSADHARNCVNAALDMAKCVVDSQVGKHESEPLWRVRIGVHSGPVVAGVVGKRRFAYDIWGDTVNVASRMQANSMPNRVNISAATWHLVNDAFECEPRELLEVKGKGLQQMYLVRSPK